MRGVLLLSLRRLQANRMLTLILALCVAVPLFLPLATGELVRRYGEQLTARADATPLVAGAAGNRFDLTFALLYFRQSGLTPISQAEVRRINESRLGVAIPVHAVHTARGRPLIGTSPEYFELRGVTPASGTLPLMVGDATLGASLAREFELGPGDSLFSDPPDVYDIAKPSSLKLRVVGVLEPTGGPEDEAAFVSMQTAWTLDGLSHAHADPESEVDERLLIGRSEEHIAVSGALIEYNEITAENAASFHIHGDPDDLPVTGVIVQPKDAKSLTLLKARLNAGERSGVELTDQPVGTGTEATRTALQAVEPRRVIDDLLEFVVRIKSLIDALALVLGVCTALLVGLIVLLSLRLRRDELRTLNRIGCAPFTTAKLQVCELCIIGVLSVAFAAVALAVTLLLAPDLLRLV